MREPLLARLQIRRQFVLRPVIGKGKMEAQASKQGRSLGPSPDTYFVPVCLPLHDITKCLYLVSLSRKTLISCISLNGICEDLHQAGNVVTTLTRPIDFDKRIVSSVR